MKDYIMLAIIARDQSQPVPSWMQRMQVWTDGTRFAVDCGTIPLEQATELSLETLLYVLKRRDRKAEPIRDDRGEVRGIQW